MTHFLRILLLFAGSGVSVLCAVVTNCSEGELRAAIAQGGTVTFACSGTISASHIVITNNVKLDGSGSEVRLSGNGSQRIFELAPNSTLELVNLSLVNGRHVGADSPGYPVKAGSGQGGAVWMNNATLRASNCLFVDNVALGGSSQVLIPSYAYGSYGGDAYGGAIYAATSSVFLTDCTFTNNSARGGDGGLLITLPGNTVLPAGLATGGAIYLHSSLARFSTGLWVSNTVVKPTGHSSVGGGAISALYTDLVCTNSSFVANRGMTNSRYGEGNGGGGAVSIARGNYTFAGCNFSSNSAYVTGSSSHLGSGGAISSSSATVTVNSCTFNANTSENGGGISGADLTVTVDGTRFTNNTAKFGGALRLSVLGTLSGFGTVSNSTFVGNSAESGGALYLEKFGSLSDCTFISNNASAGNGGGIFTTKNAAINNCRFVFNTATGSSLGSGSGGAIYFDNTGPETNTIVGSIFAANVANGVGTTWGGAIKGSNGGVISNCAFYSNIVRWKDFDSFSAGGGGALFLRGIKTTCSVVNCTFVGNVVDGTNSRVGGGAIFLSGNNDPSLMAFQFCTIVSNYCSSGALGGGIYAGGTTNLKVSLRGVILAGNFVGNNPENYVNGPSLSIDLGYNLSSDATPLFSGTSRNNIDPLLASLADNGGPTLTMALLPRSPALNAFLEAGFPATDHRGIARPQGFAPDIGAYEAAVITSITRSNQNFWVTYPSVPNHTYTLQASDAAGPPWLNLQNRTSITTSVLFTVSNSAPRQFFRVLE